jgi:hypothetical protein
MFFHDAVATRKSPPVQFFVQADRGQVRIAFQKLCDAILVRLQQSGPARTLTFRFPVPLAPVGEQCGGGFDDLGLPGLRRQELA